MQFNNVSEFIYRIVSDLYGIELVNYLDDFIVIASSKEEGQWTQSMVINSLPDYRKRIFFDMKLVP